MMHVPMIKKNICKDSRAQFQSFQTFELVNTSFLSWNLFVRGHEHSQAKQAHKQQSWKPEKGNTALPLSGFSCRDSRAVQLCKQETVMICGETWSYASLGAAFLNLQSKNICTLWGNKWCEDRFLRLRFAEIFRVCELCSEVKILGLFASFTL